jgi:hypothetical protein
MPPRHLPPSSLRWQRAMPTLCKKPRDRKRSRDREDDDDERSSRRATRRERRAPEAALPITGDNAPAAPTPDHE